MEVLAFTDFHGDEKAVERAVHVSEERAPDLILVMGDLVFHGRRSEEALEKLGGTCRRLLFVPGNMDPHRLAEFSSDNIYSIHGRCLSYMNVDFLGLGGAPKGPFGTSFEYDEEYADKILNKGLKGCRGDRLVVVSHSPPYGSRLDLTSQGIHVGSRALRGFIEKTKPSLVVCGHIHEARGIDRLSRAVTVNPGPVYAGYYAHIEIRGEIKVKLESF